MHDFLYTIFNLARLLAGGPTGEIGSLEESLGREEAGPELTVNLWNNEGAVKMSRY